MRNQVTFIHKNPPDTAFEIRHFSITEASHTTDYQRSFLDQDQMQQFGQDPHFA